MKMTKKEKTLRRVFEAKKKEKKKRKKINPDSEEK